MYLKWKPVAQSGGSTYTADAGHGATSGQTSAIKTVTTSYSGKQIESIMNYNRFCAMEYINAPQEHKVYLEKPEGLTAFERGTVVNDARRSFLGAASGVRYAIHELMTGLRGMT